MLTWLSLLSFVSGLTLVSRPHAAPASPGIQESSETRADGDARPELRAALEAAFEASAGDFWGAALVVKDGRTCLSAVRGTALEGRPVASRTLFDVGSISKSFTAAAVLALVESGELALDDPLAKHLEGIPEGARAITIRHLLNHTSGLPSEVAFGVSREDAVRKILSAPLRASPGSRHLYSNGNYTLLAALLEQVAGEPFESVVRSRVFVPAGLESTGFVQGRDMDLEWDSPRRFQREGKPVEAGTATYYAWGWGFRGSTGVVTTVEELVRYCRALASGRVLGEGALKELWSPGPGGYAGGWFVRNTSRGTRLLSHTGSTRGYRASLAFFPDEDVVIALASNEEANLNRIDSALQEVLFPGTPRRSKLQPEELDFWANARASQVPVIEGRRVLEGCPGWRVVSGDPLWCYVNAPFVDADTWLFGLYLRKAPASRLLESLKRALETGKESSTGAPAQACTLDVADAEINGAGWCSFEEAGMTIEVLAATGEGESGRIRLELRLADGSRPVRFLADRAIAQDFHDQLAAALGIR